MPNQQAIFALGQAHVGVSDGTNLLTSGVNFYAPVSCKIVGFTMNGRTMTTTDVLTVFMYPISDGVGAASTVVASAMFIISSGDFGSYAGSTVRDAFVVPLGTSGTSGPQTNSTIGDFLNKGDGINVSWTTGGTIGNIKGVTVQVWAQPKR